MAEICLTYLNSKLVKDIPAHCSLHIPNMPFLKYGSLYWGVHAKRELSGHARSLALQLLEDCRGHVSIKFLLKAEHSRFYPEDTDMSMLIRGLHWASFFGIVEAVDSLIEMRFHDTDAGDFCGVTPLAWAPWMAMKKWGKYYSSGRRSTRT